jgi:putative transposase
VRRRKLVLHAYVLMRNHYNLLIETPQANLSQAMAERGGAYTQGFNRRAGHPAYAAAVGIRSTSARSRR